MSVKMGAQEMKRQHLSYPKCLFASSFSTKWCFSSAKLVSSPEIEQEDQKHGNDQTRRKPGGWKAMPYILGNETFERLATFGLLANFMVYLTREFHMDQVLAANIINIWSGVTNFAPLVGAFISDAYAGKFRTIAFASIASLMGMVTVTLTAWMPQLHPQCNSPHQPHCTNPTTSQLSVLLLGLSLLSAGTAGIRPCSIPFGVDQFDPTTEEGVKGINSFYNWYYTTFTVVLLITQTIVVYIQDSVSWVLGFGIPTVLMVFSIVTFFFGSRIYVHVKPEGSVFSGIAEVVVAAYRKRNVEVVVGEKVDGVYYDPPLRESVLTKLPLTNQFRFLNKAAMILDNDLNPDGSRLNRWRLCSIQQVEELKCLIKIVPIWATGIVAFTSMSQQGTFTVSQALKMDRHLGPNFQIPAGSLGAISMLTIALWLPFYDQIVVPAFRKITKHEGGITLLQRIGVGIVFSILSMVVAALIERVRRAAALVHPHGIGVAPMSVMWLAPQLILMGFCEAFNIIGLIEFFNRQFPEHMRSFANSLIFASFAMSNYLSSLVVTVVHHVTGGRSQPDWLTNNINAGRLDYFYFLLAGMGVLNFFYFLYCARRYQYKSSRVQIDDEDDIAYLDVELNMIKP